MNINDVLSAHAQHRHGFGVKRLDRRDPAGEWREILVEDLRVSLVKSNCLRPSSLARQRITNTMASARFDS
jgi:hypothetical protein